MSGFPVFPYFSPYIIKQQLRTRAGAAVPAAGTTKEAKTRWYNLDSVAAFCYYMTEKSIRSYVYPVKEPQSCGFFEGCRLA